MWLRRVRSRHLIAGIVGKGAEEKDRIDIIIIIIKKQAKVVVVVFSGSPNALRFCRRLSTSVRAAEGRIKIQCRFDVALLAIRWPLTAETGTFDLASSLCLPIKRKSDVNRS